MIRLAPRTGFRLLVPILALLLSTRQAEPETNEENKAIGDHFLVVCHFANREACERALEIAETVYPMVADFYGAGIQPSERKLELHLYPDVKEYEAAERQLTFGQFKRNLSFAHWGTQSAHIALQPAGARDLLPSIGLPSKVQRLVAHEAAHVSTYTICGNYRAHPRWFAEGTVQLFESRCGRKLGFETEPRRDPARSSQMALVKALEQRGELPTPSLILEGGDLGLDFYDTYAVDWLFFATLATELGSEEMRKFGRAVRALPSGRDFRESLGDHASLLVKSTGLKEKWTDRVRALEPEWEAHDHSLAIVDRHWIQLAGEADAIAWRADRLESDSWEMTGTLELLNGDSRLDVLLDRSASGYVRVSFEAGQLAVHERLRDSSSQLTRTSTSLQQGEHYSFRISYSNHTLRAQIGELDPVMIETKRKMNGSWGLGAGAGSAGRWRDVKLERTR